MLTIIGCNINKSTRLSSISLAWKTPHYLARFWKCPSKVTFTVKFLCISRCFISRMWQPFFRSLLLFTQLDFHNIKDVWFLTEYCLTKPSENPFKIGCVNVRCLHKKWQTSIIYRKAPWRNMFVWENILLQIKMYFRWDHINNILVKIFYYYCFFIWILLNRI